MDVDERTSWERKTQASGDLARERDMRTHRAAYSKSRDCRARDLSIVVEFMDGILRRRPRKSVIEKSGRGSIRRENSVLRFVRWPDHEIAR